MKAWATIYNFFALLILLFMIMIMQRDIRANEKEFESARLSKAVDYATEGAFLASLEGGNLGISYQDLQNLRIDPTNVLYTFKNIIALSYDMSLSQDNMDSLDRYISSAVLAVSDGYYISTLSEVDTGRLAPQRGGEYQLKWGVKKPYTIKYQDDVVNKDRYVAFNLSTKQFAMAATNKANNSLYLISGEDFTNDYALNATNGITPSYDTKKRVSPEVVTAVNRTIMDDINFNIDKRNQLYRNFSPKDFVYLPSVTTTTGINAITKPSLFITLSNVDFGGSQKLEAKSVGGFTIAKKRRVLGFIDKDIKYYCYEGQIDDVSTVQQFYNTLEEAANAGYKPNLDFLRRPLTD